MARTKAEARKNDDKPTKSRGVKAKPAKDTPKGATFVVSSLQEWLPDGFHSYQGPGDLKTDSVHKSLKAANKRARELFYKHNPWGLEEDEIEDMDVDETEDGMGCLTLTVCPPDSEIWKVEVEMVTGKQKKK